MAGRVVEIFDSTLRDGSQGEGLSFSVEDKLRIVDELDALGVAYIEAGNPGSNVKDLTFFQRLATRHLSNARIVAFGSTRRHGVSCDEDRNLASLLEADVEHVAIFGKNISSPEQLKNFVAAMQQASSLPLFMGVDEELPSVLEGNIEACYIHGMLGENITDEYLIWGVPLVFGVGIDSMDNIYEFMNSDLYQELVAGDFEEAGYKAYVAFADCDHGIFTCDRQINSYHDLEGLRLRSHGGGFADQFLLDIGCNPITITSTELSTALMQGTVDGMETGKIYTDKSAFPNVNYFYECASDYAGCGNAVILSLDFYNSLPAEYQEAVDRAGAELTEWAKEEAKTRNDESLQNLQDKGMVVTQITEEDALSMFADFWPTLEAAMAENDELAQLFWYAYENYCPYDFGISQ